MDTPIAARNIDASKVTFVPGPAKAGRNPSIAIKYNGRNLSILVPRADVPGGVVIRENETGTSYTLMASMKGCDPYAKERAPETDDMSKFYNFLFDLEKMILAAAEEQSVKWFGKRRTAVVLAESFKSLMRVSNDKVDGEYVPNGKYPPSFTVKVPVYDGRVATEIVDAQRNPVYATPETLGSIFPKGVSCNLVVSGSIYVIAGGGFGVTWRLQTAQVIPRAKASPKDYFEVIQTEESPSAGGGPLEESQVVGDGGPPDEQPSADEINERNMRLISDLTGSVGGGGAPPPGRKRRPAAAP